MWKNVKDYYRITHIVQIRSGRICIGSPYVCNLISIGPDAVPKWGNLGPSRNDDLARYWREMEADPVKLGELVRTPDTFAASLSVYTYSGGEILEKQCEFYGYPNVTHEGDMMFENTFSPDRAQVIQWAIKNAGYGIESTMERASELAEDLRQVEMLKEMHRANLAKLKLLVQ